MQDRASYSAEICSHSIAVKVHSISAQERIILPETMVSPKYYNGLSEGITMIKLWPPMCQSFRKDYNDKVVATNVSILQKGLQ
jgi:hypothetical protein